MSAPELLPFGRDSGAGMGTGGGLGSGQKPPARATLGSAHAGFAPRAVQPSTPDFSADFILIGAPAGQGSSAPALALRLVEAGHSVLVIEPAASESGLSAAPGGWLPPLAASPGQGFGSAQDLGTLPAAEGWEPQDLRGAEARLARLVARVDPKRPGFAPIFETAGYRLAPRSRAPLAPRYWREAAASGRLRRLTATPARLAFDGINAEGLYLTDGRFVQARRELVLAGGALEAVRLLLASGIGPASELRAQGLLPLLDRPGLGADLADQLELSFAAEPTEQPPLSDRLWAVPLRAWQGAQWLFGFAAALETHSGLLCGERPQDAIGYRFAPGTLPDGASLDGLSLAPLAWCGGGALGLTGPDGQAAWDFDCTLPLAAPLALVGALLGAPVDPGHWCPSRIRRAGRVMGGLRLGDAADPMAVCDTRGRLIGARGLRIAGAGLFAAPLAADFEQACLLIGDRIADHILCRAHPGALSPAAADPMAVAAQ